MYHRDNFNLQCTFLRNQLSGVGPHRLPDGWSMKPTLAKEIVLDALLMVVWRRKPKQNVIIHSDQEWPFSRD